MYETVKGRCFYFFQLGRTWQQKNIQFRKVILVVCPKTTMRSGQSSTRGPAIDPDDTTASIVIPAYH